ncbi:M20/M25/M40 family metallo-hydrolase [Methanosarcina sp. T3]|uniref:M20/M25/M40 family metallo-hydrolase n=1 Tax=Methanosarcina sp. T3 TaxID=3439062 RepID=UPI003F866714
MVPGTEQQWEHGAFSGDIADGYIWVVAKIMILAIPEAVEMHLKQGFQPTRTIYLVFGQDEEVMGPEGLKQIVKELKFRGINEVALVLDEGLPLTTGLFPGITAPIALIGTAEKGYTTMQLKVAGSCGHSAMPPNNSNISILAQAITKLEATPFPCRITQPVRDQMRFLGPELPEKSHEILEDIAFGNGTEMAETTEQERALEYTENLTVGWQARNTSEDQFIKYMLTSSQTTAMLHTITAVTMVNGGVKENVMLPIATVVVNFRILQGETVLFVILSIVS